MTPYPAVSEALVDEVLTTLGVDRATDVEPTVTAFRGWFPAGSTAKWLAELRTWIDRPPGDDE